MSNVCDPMPPSAISPVRLEYQPLGEKEIFMVYKSLFCLVLVGSGIGCSSSPYEPVNETEPIGSMDDFFSGGRTSAYSASSDYNYRGAPNYDTRPNHYNPRY
jgi:hypothetical protein